MVTFKTIQERLTEAGIAWVKSSDKRPIFYDYMNVFIIEHKYFNFRDFSYNWEKIEHLKSLTRHIDYGCKFKNGKCQGEWESPSCCCEDCKRNIGFLKMIREDDIDYYTERFDEKTGFWRQGKGCILDRNKRSVTCISYTCYAIRSNKSNRLLNDELYALRNAIETHEKKIKEYIKFKYAKI